MGSNKTFHQKQQSMAAESNNASESKGNLGRPFHKERKEQNRPSI